MGAEDESKKTAGEWREQLDRELDDLKTVRDELKVKIHLAKADAKDTWNNLEEKWPEVESSLKRFEGRATKALDEIGEATRSLFGELRQGYQRLKKDL